MHHLSPAVIIKIFQDKKFEKEGVLIIVALGMWEGFKKSYIIYWMGQGKSYVCLQGGWVGQKLVQNRHT